MSRLLVTGANGFVGSHFFRLSRDKYVIRGAVRRDEVLLGHGCERSVVGDLGPDTNWTEALNDVDCVVHLAARVHVMKEHAADPLNEFRSINLHGTLRLANQAVKAGARRFIFVSSIKVNGEGTTTRPYSADDTPAPVDPYGVSKHEAEQALLELGEKTGLEIVIVRPPLVYGPGVRGNFLRLMNLVNKGVPLPLASVNNVRSMVSVTNLCELLSICVEHPGAAGEIFLASDRESLSTPDLIRRIAFYMDKPARLFPFPLALLKLAGRMLHQSDVIERLCGSLEVDNASAKDRLNWLPPQSIEEGLRETVNWYTNSIHV